LIKKQGEAPGKPGQRGVPRHFKRGVVPVKKKRNSAKAQLKKNHPSEGREKIVQDADAVDARGGRATVVKKTEKKTEPSREERSPKREVARRRSQLTEGEGRQFATGAKTIRLRKRAVKPPGGNAGLDLTHFGKKKSGVQRYLPCSLH